MSGERITYEVTLEPDPAILREFETWLEYHVDDVIALPGFTGATIHKGENPETGAALRIVRYELENQAALERYLREDAPRMRAEGTSRFGDRFRASRRIVHEGRDAALTDARPCPNCDQLLWGQYCANCGQRARTRMITLWELLKDAGDLIASLDSRLWRTLGLLLFRPGRLTVDYLEGKRARYVPPFRLFIAASIVFFFVASLLADFSIGDAVVIDGDTPQQETAEPGPPDVDVTVAGAQFDEMCNVNYEGVPPWFEELVPPERAREICERITLDRGRSFMRAVLSNIPAMMFLFLPVMALVMKLAYPLSGRYYAEHLLFLVHYHSFFYLFSLLLILLEQGGARLAPGVLPTGLINTAAFIYLMVYLFRALRRVYGQGFWLTLFKYVLMGLSYLLALVTTFVGLLLYTAVTL
ncbi:DUF4286 family protein [Thioalkalivibrio sp. XN8]|uniref:DUF4286 family protein n=1 Tax=Thioalkalivibrio sp. XN8 TaxID=2712863 RepID=UPI0013ED7A93|nr:DUF4286 family protein [Thioalkalivibrio sp. XN8]